MTAADLIENGDVIVLRRPDDSFLEPNSALKIPVVYESEAVAVFDKPAGVPVHPSQGHRTDTLGNLCAYLYPELTFRPIDRLDRDTSGLVAVAKDPYCARQLQGSLEKTYIAAVCGRTEPEGVICAPIGRAPGSVILRCVREDGRPAVTRYRKIAESSAYTLEEIRLETGRTHQIRVHFSHIGCPLAGDGLYGGGCGQIRRQALHCGELRFREPLTGEEVSVRSELPLDIRALFPEEKL
ncbi:MAG: RluA family pseudouridine synthase [Ruminococcus sp.]|nr:RluA family pseudouridine synthase [Ruminococcus sp.]